MLLAASYCDLSGLVFAALFVVSQRRDPTIRLKSKSLLEPRRRPQFYAVAAGKNSTFSLSSKTAVPARCKGLYISRRFITALLRRVASLRIEQH